MNIHLFLFSRKESRVKCFNSHPSTKNSAISWANLSAAATDLDVLRIKVFRENFLLSDGSRSQEKPATAPRGGLAAAQGGSRRGRGEAAPLPDKLNNHRPQYAPGLRLPGRD